MIHFLEIDSVRGLKNRIYNILPAFKEKLRKYVLYLANCIFQLDELFGILVTNENSEIFENFKITN